MNSATEFCLVIQRPRRIDHAATDFASIFKKPKSRRIKADRISVIAFGLAIIGMAAFGRQWSADIHLSRATIV